MPLRKDPEIRNLINTDMKQKSVNEIVNRSDERINELMEQATVFINDDHESGSRSTWSLSY